MLKKFAVFGNPIKHSLSPKIHQLFAQQFDHQLQYDAIELPVGHFSAKVKELVEHGLIGANVTVPFKQEAIVFANKASERATIAGAANTLTFNDGDCYADNTDGKGLVSDIQRLTGTLNNKDILLIGAGGATRGVVLPLLQAGAASLTIVNRTKAKAIELQSIFSPYGKVLCGELMDNATSQYHIVINCTSSSLHGELPGVNSSVFEHSELIYDMFYQKELTSFLSYAQQINKNAVLADGIGMLVGQAAESYRLWWGVSPDLSTTISALGY